MQIVINTQLLIKNEKFRNSEIQNLKKSEILRF